MTLAQSEPKKSCIELPPKLRRSSATVANSREGHRLRGSGRESQHRRWDREAVERRRPAHGVDDGARYPSLMEGCFLRLRNTRVFASNVIGTNRRPLATASLTAGSLAARIAVSSRSMKISANMEQPPLLAECLLRRRAWGLKLSLNF